MAALVDLWFTDNKNKRIYNCSTCRKNPNVALQRKCDEPGFENLKKPRAVDSLGVELTFCPGKATWYAEISDAFEQCRVALESGILPKEGALEDQDELFCEVFYTFVERWRTRQYKLLWNDVGEFVEAIFKSFSGKGGRGKTRG